METPAQKAFRILVGKPYHYFEKKVNEGNMIIPVLVILVIGTILILLLTKVCSADEINLNKIMMIESGGNPHAIGKGGDIGLFQITLPILADYDASHDDIIWQSELFDPYLNRVVAEWYLTERIPEMLRHYHKTVSVRNVIICYNAGISYVAYHKHLPQTTINYLRKYGA